jgi:molecular chaperone GrpE
MSSDKRFKARDEKRIIPVEDGNDPVNEEAGPEGAPESASPDMESANAEDRGAEGPSGQADSETRAENGKPAASSREAEYLENLLRLKAEFDNYRKRVEREKEEFFSIAKGRVIQALLPVLDDLDRFQIHSRDMDGRMAAGFELVLQKMKSVLSGEGLEVLEAVGKPFDPRVHEALGLVDTDPESDGRVVEELERGYALQGRLLRPSRVRVGRHTPADAGDGREKA